MKKMTVTPSAIRELKSAAESLTAETKQPHGVRITLGTQELTITEIRVSPGEAATFECEPSGSSTHTIILSEGTPLCACVTAGHATHFHGA